MIFRFHPYSVRKILVISLTNLGDIILTTPVLTALRENFPNASLSVLIGPKGRELLEGSLTVDEVIVYDKRSLSFFDKMKLILSLRRKKFDLALDLRNTLIPYLIGARYKNGPRLGRHPRSMREQHLGQLFSSFELSPIRGHFDFFSAEDSESCTRKLNQLGISESSGFVIIAPGAGSYLKRWGIERFKEVARYLKDRGKEVIVAGSSDERNLGEALERSQGARNVCGVLALRELAALIDRASLVVSCDSALMHLANELSVPVVAVFGPTDEKKYGKFGALNKVVRREIECAPCELAHCKLERRFCLDDLPAEDVIRACEELLGVKAH